MEKRTLTPRRIIDVEGKLAYAEGFQSWNLLRLKKEIVNEFPQLKEKRSAFSYRLAFFRSFEGKFCTKFCDEEKINLGFKLIRHHNVVDKIYKSKQSRQDNNKQN